MSAIRAVRAPVPLEAPEATKELGGLVEWGLLGRLGWNADTEIFAPDAEDRTFGFAQCSVAVCDQITRGLSRLCWRCERNWKQAEPDISFERFCQEAPARVKNRGGRLCRVCCTPGHERPVGAHALCSACAAAMVERDQSVEGYIDGDDYFGPAVPRPSFGVCEVGVCGRWAQQRQPPLCEPHNRGWHSAGQPRGAPFTLWCSRQPVVDVDPRTVVLRGLPDSARLELLYSLQQAAKAERRTRTAGVQFVVNALLAQGSGSVFELCSDGMAREPRLFVAFTRDQVRLALATPAAETAGDDWDLRVFGQPGGFLRFGRISQQWLKDTAKLWASERINTLETARVLQAVLRALGVLSESLRRHRDDRGFDQGLLSRADLSAFANDLAHLEAAGRLSRFTRRRWLLEVDQFLREARSMGLSRPGGPLAGLPEDVILRPSDRIRSASLDEGGRALPQTVIDQLLAPAALASLEARYGPDVRAMVELQAEVGRRTGELCGLRWGCLSFDEVVDEAGHVRAAPVLVHDMPKVAVRGYHLPIDGHAAEIIRAQQARVQERYPDTATSQLALFPTPQKNPRGVKTYNPMTLATFFRSWVDGLTQLVGPGGEPYDRSDMSPYSWRHSYAQRHADLGTPVEVLAALMGHTNLTTTQTYYRVNDQRKRKAVDLLAALQVDRDGNRSRPTLERLLDSEALRDAVGQVAVPFGVCREPTNIKAHGQACPFRHQCFGCVHFRSDPSYLPEMRGYLNHLLADGERLRAATGDLDDWARNSAIPSGEEIAAVRRIIDRCQDMISGLPDGQQSEIDEAVTTARRVRAQLDTSIPVRFLGVIGQSAPTLFPNVQREQRQDVGDER